MGAQHKAGACGASRRHVIAVGMGGAALVALPLAWAQAPRVDEADDTAVQLGYKHDTTKVDAAKYPKHQAKQECVGCGLWQGKSTDEWAGCAMFGRKQIAAKGWCMAWVAKPA